MIRKKSNTKQANKRKPVAKEKAATGDKKTDNKAVKVAVEESFLIRWRFHLLLFFVFCVICPFGGTRSLHPNH